MKCPRYSNCFKSCQSPLSLKINKLCSPITAQQLLLARSLGRCHRLANTLPASGTPTKEYQVAQTACFCFCQTRWSSDFWSSAPSTVIGKTLSTGKSPSAACALPPILSSCATRTATVFLTQCLSTTSAISGTSTPSKTAHQGIRGFPMTHSIGRPKNYPFFEVNTAVPSFKEMGTFILMFCPSKGPFQHVKGVSRGFALTVSSNVTS